MYGVKWRKQYDLQRDIAEGYDCIVFCLDESKTQQQFAKDADLNEIVRRCGVKDGAVLPTSLYDNVDPRYYCDMSDVPDLRTALDRVGEAQVRFMALPAALRERFHNRPDKLYEFVSREENCDEAVRLGLLSRRKEPEAPPVPAKPASS